MTDDDDEERVTMLLSAFYSVTFSSGFLLGYEFSREQHPTEMSAEAVDRALKRIGTDPGLVPPLRNRPHYDGGNVTPLHKRHKHPTEPPPYGEAG